VYYNEFLPGGMISLLPGFLCAFYLFYKSSAQEDFTVG